MNFSWLPYNKTILDWFFNVWPGIGHGDLVDFIRIQPNLPSPTLEHIACKALLVVYPALDRAPLPQLSP